jgi:hypothetical protein
MLGNERESLLESLRQKDNEISALKEPQSSAKSERTSLPTDSDGANSRFLKLQVDKLNGERAEKVKEIQSLKEEIQRIRNESASAAKELELKFQSDTAALRVQLEHQMAEEVEKARLIAKNNAAKEIEELKRSKTIDGPIVSAGADETLRKELEDSRKSVADLTQEKSALTAQVGTVEAELARVSKEVEAYSAQLQAFYAPIVTERDERTSDRCYCCLSSIKSPQSQFSDLLSLIVRGKVESLEQQLMSGTTTAASATEETEALRSVISQLVAQKKMLVDQILWEVKRNSALVIQDHSRVLNIFSRPSLNSVTY